MSRCASEASSRTGGAARPSPRARRTAARVQAAGRIRRAPSAQYSSSGSSTRRPDPPFRLPPAQHAAAKKTATTNLHDSRLCERISIIWLGGLNEKRGQNEKKSIFAGKFFPRHLTCLVLPCGRPFRALPSRLFKVGAPARNAHVHGGGGVCGGVDTTLGHLCSCPQRGKHSIYSPNIAVSHCHSVVDSLNSKGWIDRWMGFLRCGQ